MWAWLGWNSPARFLSSPVVVVELSAGRVGRHLPARWQTEWGCCSSRRDRLQSCCQPCTSIGLKRGKGIWSVKTSWNWQKLIQCSIQDSGLALTASGYWLSQAAVLAALPMQERAAPPRRLHRNNQKAAERIWKLWELSWEAKNPRIVCNKEAFGLHGIILGLYSLHHCVGSSFFALHFRVFCSSSRRAHTVIISSCLPICANFTLQPDLSLPTYMSSLLIQISLSLSLFLLLSASTTRARQGGSFIKGKRL